MKCGHVRVCVMVVRELQKSFFSSFLVLSVSCMSHTMIRQDSCKLMMMMMMIVLNVQFLLPKWNLQRERERDGSNEDAS